MSERLTDDELGQLRETATDHTRYHKLNPHLTYERFLDWGVVPNRDVARLLDEIDRLRGDAADE